MLFFGALLINNNEYNWNFITEFVGDIDLIIYNCVQLELDRCRYTIE